MVKRITRKSILYGWVVCSLAALFYTYEYLLRIEPSLMVPQLMRNFQITAAGLGFLSALYYYAYTPLQAVVGTLTDHYGPRRVLTLAIASCALGSLIFGLSTEVYIAGLGRILIGIGSAFAFIGVLKLAAMWLPRNRFALFAGIATALGMVGAAIGDVEISFAVTRLGWHRVALASAFFGIILIPIFILFVHEKQNHYHKKDHPATQDLLESIRVFGKVIKNRQIILAGLIGCMLYLSLSVFAEMWGIPFIHAITGRPEHGAAEYNMLVFLGWLIGAPFHGWFSDRIHSRRIQLIFGTLLAALMMTLILIWPDMRSWLFASLLFLFGFFASAEVLCFAVARDEISVRHTATAMGVINMLIMLGGMILQPLVAVLLNLAWGGQLSHGVRIYGVLAYRSALVIVPVMMLVACLLSFLLKESYYNEEQHA